MLTQQLHSATGFFHALAHRCIHTPHVTVCLAEDGVQRCFMLQATRGPRQQLRLPTTNRSECVYSLCFAGVCAGWLGWPNKYNQAWRHQHICTADYKKATLMHRLCVWSVVVHRGCTHTGTWALEMVACVAHHDLGYEGFCDLLTALHVKLHVEQWDIQRQRVWRISTSGDGGDGGMSLSMSRGGSRRCTVSMTKAAACFCVTWLRGVHAGKGVARVDDTISR